MSEHLTAAFIIAVVFSIAALLFAVPALPQGHHPTGPDPYAKSTDQNGQDCCRGKDCSRWEGADPKRVTSPMKGYLFGPHFLPDDRLIKWETLTPPERWHHQLCLRGQYVACGYVSSGI